MEKSLENIQRDVQSRYCHKLDAMQIENEFDLILYCSYVGRLYSLGITQYMPKADDLLHNSSYSKKVNQIFLERIDQGIRDLQEQTGKEIGIALSELQDMHCFIKYTSYPFSDQVRQNFLRWIDAGLYADVNAETIDYINDYLDANPLSSSDVLEALSQPTTQEVRELEFILSGCHCDQCQPEQVNGGWEISDGENNFRLEFKPSAKNALCFEIYEQQQDEKIPVENVSIRQDVLPAVQNPNAPLLWSVDYKQFSGLDVSERKLKPLTIRLPMGGICKIAVPGSTTPISVEKKPFRFQKYNNVPVFAMTQLSNVMSAAILDKPEFLQMSITGLDVFLDICVDKSNKQVLVQAYSSQKNCMTDALDGWSLYGENGIFLGTFNGKTVKYKFSENCIPALLEDKNETPYLLTAKEEN